MTPQGTIRRNLKADLILVNKFKKCEFDGVFTRKIKNFVSFGYQAI